MTIPTYHTDAQAVAAPPPPPNRDVTVEWDAGRLVFSDDFIYTFKDPSKLQTALVFRERAAGAKPPNQKLALVGDSAYKTALSTTWFEMNHSTDDWYDLQQHGLQTNQYLAEVFDRSGLGSFTWPRLFPGDRPMTVKEKGTCVEAVFGAVFLDSGSDVATLREVMLRFDIWWPESEVALESLRAEVHRLRTRGVLTRPPSAYI